MAINCRESANRGGLSFLSEIIKIIRKGKGLSVNHLNRPTIIMV